MRQTIFEYAPEGASGERISIEANNDGGATFKVSSLGGGYASIDLPVEQFAELGRKLLARAKAYEMVG